MFTFFSEQKMSDGGNFAVLTYEFSSLLVRMRIFLSFMFLHDIPGSGKNFLKFGITAEEILKIDGSLEELNKLGGMKGVAHKLRVDIFDGLEGNPEELKLRSDTFGSNTYPVKKPKHFLVMSSSIIRPMYKVCLNLKFLNESGD